MSPETIPPAVGAVLREAEEYPWRLRPCSNGGALLHRGPEADAHKPWNSQVLQVVPEADAAAIVYAVNHAQGWMDEIALLRAFEARANEHMEREEKLLDRTRGERDSARQALRDAEAALATAVCEVDGEDYRICTFSHCKRCRALATIRATLKPTGTRE